ncbi:DsbA family oxidoreductase [Kineococcus endophyticus]|uniref:DsbA family oxidoreductase n=1 Tax=Kineococcus endophyticus TaxID=1181883 RepID=A0ABV3PAF9_9ACTN
MKVEIWSDVVCPWCYIGKRRFESALRDFEHADDVEVVWRSFELDPTTETVHEKADGPSDAHLRRLSAKFGQPVEQVAPMVAHVDAMAAAEGLEFHQDISVPANTVKAHQLLHLAAERGVQGAVKERLLRANFTEGEPVGDDETLVRLVAEAGLDADEARAVLAEDRYLDAVRADIAEARALGARGVPFFVVDRTYGISGAQPTEQFAQVLRQAWAESHPLTLVGDQDADACGPDGCAI